MLMVKRGTPYTSFNKSGKSMPIFISLGRIRKEGRMGKAAEKIPKDLFFSYLLFISVKLAIVVISFLVGIFKNGGEIL